jgi:aspartate beta-hydroxylase
MMANPNPTADARIDDLINASDRAAAAGKQADAARLLAEAQAAAPGHPRVLSALGLYALKWGDLDTARRHLNEAVIADPTAALLWFHLALVCRAQRDSANEILALDKALAFDPRLYFALLQKATLLERQSQPKQAAKVFTAFLQCVPEPARRPPALQQAVQHAEQAVAANNAALAAVLNERLAADRKTHRDAPHDRFDHCLDILLGRRRVYTSQPTFMHFPHLPAIEFYDRKDFPWLGALESAAEDMRSELLQVLASDVHELVPYVDYPDGLPLDQWRDLNRSRRWSAYYLLKDGARNESHLARCPKTAALLAAAPLADIPGQAPTAFFSVIDPKTRIPPHTGVTNTRLVVHVPLIIPPGCGFRVGAETREWRVGQAWAFDDTIEHEAWNDSDAARAILIIDIWNPFLSAAERALVRKATSAIADFNRE